MTHLMNLFVFVITIKFQFTQTQFLDKEDYFNHNQYALPEFIVDGSLFTTKKKLDLINPPWITKKVTTITNTTKSPTTVQTTTESTASVTTTFESKLKWVQLPAATTQVIRSSKNNNTNELLPFWLKLSFAPATEPTTATTRLTPYSTTQPTTKSTSKPTSKFTTRSTITPTTRKVVTTTTPRRTTLLSGKEFFSEWNKKTEMVITEKTNKIASDVRNADTRLATGTSTGTATGPFTKPTTYTTNKTTVTNTLIDELHFAAKLNKIKPNNPTIAPMTYYPTVFQDLTMIRNGLREESKPVKFIDGTNQATIKPEAKEVDFIDERKYTTNKLQDNEVIEYNLLATEPFSKFLELLMQQLAVMDGKYAEKFFRTFERQFAVLLNSGSFDALGPVTKAYIQNAISDFQFPTDHKQRLLSMAYNIFANRNDTMSHELNSLLDYMDMLYGVEAEKHMERVLNETIAYPNISKTAEEITEGFIEDVLLNPLKRISGTTQGNKLLAAIADITSITNKTFNINARRVISGNYYQYPKRNKEVKRLYFRNNKRRRRPKFVFTNKYRKILLADTHSWLQTTQRTGEDKHKMTLFYRNNIGDINNYLNNFDSQEEKMRSSSKNNGKTKIYSLDFRKDKRKHSDKLNNSNAVKKVFRASLNNFRQNKMVNNPFRTLLYNKDRENRFEKYYTEKETYNMVPYFQRTRPTTKSTEQTITFTTNKYKNKEYDFGKQSSAHKYESNNMYHKQELKYDKEANRDKIQNFVRQSVKNELNSFREEESKESCEEFTTNATCHGYKPNKVKEVILTQKNTKLPKSVYKNKTETTPDIETTQSEFKEANISLKHFYFKPVIILNKSGDDDQFVSIEFDGEPNIIDFSMKVKLKKPITQPTTQKLSERQRNTETSETSTSPRTNALRVLNPYKMDNYFKNNGTENEVNRTADDKESSTDYSDSSSDDDGSGKLGVSSEEGQDDQPQFFGRLRKIKNRGHKKQKLRSKKHRESKKHHHKTKHEKRKGHHRHGKHGKKHRHKFLEAYLKKYNHDRKKRIKHKLKQLIDKRIVGKNFEIAFDASSEDSDEKKLIDVTIVKRAKDGKRPTISLVNKGKKLRPSDSSVSSKEVKIKHATTKEDKINRLSTKYSKHKNKIRTETTKTVTTNGKSINHQNELRNADHNKEEYNPKDDNPELSKVTNENSLQVITNEPTPSTAINVEITLLPKDSRKNKIIHPNVHYFRNLLKISSENRKKITLSPMLIPINKPKNNRDKDTSKSFLNIRNKVQTVQRRFLPIQIFNNSEYSDEEDELKNNLYDAFRHRDEIYYRRNMRHELPLKEELREESDITDEEIIFKQNIYKAIKENNRRSNHKRM